jgi:hypothetical protein
MELIIEFYFFHVVLYRHGFVISSDVQVFDFVNSFWFQYLKLKKQKASSSYLLKISKFENLNFWLFQDFQKRLS